MHVPLHGTENLQQAIAPPHQAAPRRANPARVTQVA
eukprot:CAMPEP_0173464100 /NCGR_PEP_ID=MMETSP1357-20121228/69361_1 /TAXON_ID=77926 /ORGANISM="Hemiselmis rufescens, Strain PCC563" /LENGTH=35 /DNA_ID= /DNA_START= /DNA_END= /DNA_ORIENTATION=